MKPIQWLVIGAVLATGACTEAREPRVPTAVQPVEATSAPPPQSPKATQESNYDKALRFTRCMNETVEAMYPGAVGRIKRLPDPVEGEYLRTYVTVPPDVYDGTISRMTSDGDRGWQVAAPGVFEKCKQHLPPIWPVKADPDDQRRFGRFYDCLRQRGIDVPAPDANGYLHVNPNHELQQTPEYRAAEDACRHLADDPAVKAGDR